MSILQVSKRLFQGLVYNTEITHRRHLFRMLYVIINKFDKDRLKAVGKEQACAEWLLRCGASIRWKDKHNFETSYNSLPSGKSPNLIIEEVNADEATVVDEGFIHFRGLENVKKMRFHKCTYFDDASLAQLEFVKESLQHLEISQCDVTDRGIPAFCKLQALQSLTLIDLEGVQDQKSAMTTLEKCIPQCKITFKNTLMESDT